MIMVARNALFYSALYDVYSPLPFTYLFISLLWLKIIDYIWTGFTGP